MQLYGKMIGALFGYFTFGYVGILIGAALGHLFDKGLSAHLFELGEDSKAAQDAFFKATFEIMGYVAKLDGRVSESEIKAASMVMDNLGLSAEQKKEAIGFFNSGKDNQFNLDLAIDEFLQNCAGRFALLQVFLEIEVEAASEVEGICTVKKAALDNIARRLGFAEDFISGVEARWQAEQAFENWQHQAYQQQYQQYDSSSYDRSYKTATPEDELNNAYGILGVSKDASEKEVKLAYRRLMNEHHPDKLMAKGLPEHMVKVATEKTQKIQAAYERIEKHKKGT